MAKKLSVGEGLTGFLLGWGCDEARNKEAKR